MKMFMLNLRMYTLLALLFAIVYAVVSMISFAMGVRNFNFYLVLTFVTMFIQYMIGPKLIEWTMHVRYIKKEDNPQLYEMVREMAEKARLPMPKIGISSIGVPNAFAFGRWLSDGRICVTEGIMRLLSKEELKAVIGHEMSHIKNRDVLTITLLSVIPLILYRIAYHLLFYGNNRGRRDGQNVVIFGLVALLFYFITQLLVLYASRIREYFADRGSVVLGNHPRFLASALYKLVYGSARINQETVRQVQGLKAFFVNDPSRAKSEFKELSQLDLDKSGTLDTEELRAIRDSDIKLSGADKFFEIFSTHPNMLKRIKQLSTYVKA